MELVWIFLAGAVAALVMGLLRARGERIDPVCGMQVAADTPYRMEHDGRRYRFCTRSCLHKFQADPARWLSRPPEPED